MTVLVGVIILFLLPLLTTMVWEVAVREPLLALVKRAKYRLSRKFGKELPLGELLERLSSLCQRDSSASLVMQRERLSALAVDACFEIVHSHLYSGWRPHEIEYMPLARTPPLAADLV